LVAITGGCFSDIVAKWFRRLTHFGCSCIGFIAAFNGDWLLSLDWLFGFIFSWMFGINAGFKIGCQCFGSSMIY